MKSLSKRGKLVHLNNILVLFIERTCLIRMMYINRLTISIFKFLVPPPHRIDVRLFGLGIR